MVQKLTAFIPTLKPLGFLPFYCKPLNKACYTSHECSTGTKLVGCPTVHQNKNGDDLYYTIHFTHDSHMIVSGLKLQWVTDPEEEKGCELYYDE